MSRASELLEQATPLPWDIEQGFEDAGTPDSHYTRPTDDAAILRLADYEDDPLIVRPYADAALIVYAVNRLPDYEAAVEALERLLEANWPGAQIGSDGPVVDAAVAALARLREKVPA
ncbi:MAG TPA: hypothetical protein VEW95_05400 [Candidatus Limnocylindrales bacterium]|nr:hypothetical protein [Candidatus Limnocylindrales bacterium]